jgi:3',5'-cyclic AMP phosphodiesterase CpdA
MIRRAAFGVLPLLVGLACSSSGEGDGTTMAAGNPEKAKPTALPPLASAVTTVDATLSRTRPRQSYTAGPNPATSPEALQSYLDQGFGELAPAAGEASITRVIDDSKPAPAGAGARRILRFAHLSDLQLADDESPTRVGQIDSSGFTSSALRPQDAYLCRMANASVRTINALHRGDPLAFTIMGGDNADSAQTNEVEWVLGILSGSAAVECDSGDDDDLVTGPDNDGKDPFVAEGLAMPWKWVTGNHDVLVQGNIEVNAYNSEVVVSDTATGGTRDYRNGARGIITTDTIVPDARRALLQPADLVAKVAADKDGHGLGAAEKALGRATYTFDEGPFRFLVIDTTHHSGGADGVIRQADVDATIKPLLDKAKADGKWVVLASHHATSSLTPEGGALGTKEPDALLPEAWATFIGGYPNVLFSMVGHSHQNRVRAIKPAGAGHAWWEIMTAAIADFPHQFRVVEIFDQDNGWLMLRATAVNFSVDGDPVASEGRRRGVVDSTSGWLPEDGTGNADDRNVELWIKKPQ